MIWRLLMITSCSFLWATPLDLVVVEKIRVRVFPHEKAYLPHKMDQQRSTFVVRSPEACSHYEMRSEGKKLISASKLIIIRSRDVDQWVECSAEFTLIREPGLPTYTYRGPLRVIAKDQQIEAVLHLDVEDYLRGVVPAEVMASWPMETLKSQAVAARTYAYYHLAFAQRYLADRAYDVDDTIAYQAYTGSHHFHARTDMAIHLTKHQILTHQHRVIQAFYHADSGGSTVSAEHAFSQAEHHCTAKPEPYATESKYEQVWNLRIPIRELASLDGTGSFDLQDVQSVAINSGKDPSRAKSIRLQLTQSRQVDIPMQDLRRLRNFPSTRVSARLILGPTAPEILIEGKGSGHGVGLNQRGAMILAADYQWDYRQILYHYYSKVTICRVHSGEETSMPVCGS